MHPGVRPHADASIAVGTSIWNRYCKLQSSYIDRGMRRYGGNNLNIHRDAVSR